MYLPQQNKNLIQKKGGGGRFNQLYEGIQQTIITNNVGSHDYIQSIEPDSIYIETIQVFTGIDFSCLVRDCECPKLFCYSKRLQ